MTIKNVLPLIVHFAILATFFMFGCTRIKTKNESTDEFLLYEESMNLTRIVWIDSSYCNPSFSISTPMPLDKDNIELPEEALKKIESIGYYIFQTKDNLLIQLICTKYHENSIKGFELDKSIDGIIVGLKQQVFGDSLKYQKEVIKNGKQDGTLLYGNYVDENELISFKLGVF